MALAARASELTAELDRSRAQVIAASLAERDRLRRDLHDGMGPALGGLALGLDAAESLLDTDPVKTRQILSRTRAEADRTVIEIRRIIDDLRPDVLDRSGLARALQGASWSWPADEARSQEPPRRNELARVFTRVC